MSIRKHGCGCGCFHGILSLILSLVIIAAVVLTVREAFYQYTYPVKYSSYVEDASAELGVPETLIYATIGREPLRPRSPFGGRRKRPHADHRRDL